ncbi:hypothetical protein HNY73_021990 [Argiope bruennichi]|uniref:Uncharacterized protein n=1 Tax=Argiope bruennichi TaxID=94029 RepID=A0A8T0E156_ARGBR|nr:hypothetical protein HNY73_021990 [Argiope bruennichi]
MADNQDFHDMLDFECDETEYETKNAVKEEADKLLKETKMGDCQNFHDLLDFEPDEIQYEKKNTVGEGTEKSKENEEANIIANQPSVKQLNCLKQKEDERQALMKRLEKLKEQQEIQKEKLMLKIISGRPNKNAWAHRPAKTYSRWFNIMIPCQLQDQLFRDLRSLENITT